MKLCPTCQRCYEDTDIACTQQGHDELVVARSGSRLILDKYRLDKLLARGGMGAVYAGAHVELDRPVAIKLLLPDLNADQQAFERFRREARVAARIRHPNVAEIYDYGTLAGGEAYIVMELVEGETLHECLRRVGRLPVADTVMIARQIAEGMAAAHRSGVVHRDLKPSNIILARDYGGSVLIKIIDFGIAKISEQLRAGDSTLTATGTLVGTPRYMSPEQCEGGELDARSDIYSLGVIIYEMLAGRPPFDSTSAVAIAYKHLNESPPPLAESRRDVPAPLADLVATSLTTDPSGRPQTAVELARRLAGIENSIAEPAARDQAGRTLPAEETPESDVLEIEGDDTFVTAPSADYRAVNPAPPEEGVSGKRPLSGAAKAEKSALPPPPALPAVGANGRAPVIVRIPEAPRVRRRQPSLIFVSMAIELAVTVIAMWAATRRPAAVSSQPPATSATPPSADVRPTGQSHPSPTAAVRVSPKPESKPGEAQEARARKETDDEADPTPDEETGRTSPEQARAEINGALDHWITATNTGDVKGQMSHYNSNVDAFYLTRNVSRDAVRAEKQRLYEQANKIEVHAGEPEIKVGRDGRTATTRFRKRYVIEGPEESRRGEVVQELRWVKTDAGWKIVSERDLKVIR